MTLGLDTILSQALEMAEEIQMTNDGNIQQEPQNIEMFMGGTEEEMVKVSMQAQEMFAWEADSTPVELTRQ